MRYITLNNGAVVSILPSVRGGPCELDYCIESSEVEISIRYLSGLVLRGSEDASDLPITAEARFAVLLDGSFVYPGRLVSRTRELMFIPDPGAYVAVSKWPADDAFDTPEMDSALPRNLRQLILETASIYLVRTGACVSLGEAVSEGLTAKVERTGGNLRFVGWIEDDPTHGDAGNR